MNMKDFMRIAFCITAVAVTLSGCRPTSCPISHPDDYNIELFKDEIKCGLETQLYSPKNVEEKCFASALECIQKELSVVKQECSGTLDRIDQASPTLNDTITILKGQEKYNAQIKTTECVCEKWNATSFEMFLENYESLIQKINFALGCQ